MKLYYAPGTCALACWIAMEWAQLDYEVEKVKLGSEEYLNINPLGMVPALQLDDGQIITQAGTILTFIAKQAPRAQLIPQDNLLAESRFNEIMDFLTGDFHPAFGQCLALIATLFLKRIKRLKKSNKLLTNGLILL